MVEKILVVDDDALNRELIEAFLMTEDYTVLTANSGKKALEVAFDEIPSLILLDVMMPKMNGYEVCKQLKANPETWDIPVIMLTALNSPDIYEKANKVGADEVLRQPFGLNELIETVQKRLPNNVS